MARTSRSPSRTRAAAKMASAPAPAPALAAPALAPAAGAPTTSATSTTTPPTISASIFSLPASLVLLYASTAAYAAFYQAQVPVQPALIESLRAADEASSSSSHTSPAATFAAFRSTFGIYQVVGSLLYGPLMDRLGAKRLLILSHLASFLSYALVARAASLNDLYLAAIPTVAQHAVLAGRAYVSVVGTEAAETARLLGHIAVAYGLGMVVGPGIGGWVTDVTGSLSIVAAFASAGSLATAAACWVALPEAQPAATSSTSSSSAAAPSSPSSALSLSSYLSGFLNPRVFPVIAVKVAFSLAMAIFHTSLTMSGSGFTFTPTDLGVLMSFVGGVGAVANVVLPVPVAIWRARPGSTTAGLLSVLAALLTGLFVVTSLVCRTPTHLFVLCVPLVFCTSAFSTVSSALFANAIPASLRGTASALDMAMGSGMRIVAPLVTAWVVLTATAPGGGAGAAAGPAGFVAVSWVTAGVLLVSLLLLQFVREEARDPEAEGKGTKVVAAPATEASGGAKGKGKGKGKSVDPEKEEEEEGGEEVGVGEDPAHVASKRR
jgi:MFS family permease